MPRKSPQCLLASASQVSGVALEKSTASGIIKRQAVPDKMDLHPAMHGRELDPINRHDSKPVARIAEFSNAADRVMIGQRRNLNIIYGKRLSKIGRR
jgi:hypothetical protein